MKNRRLRLTTKHAKASVRLCNVLLFFMLGALISVASSLSFTFIGSEARSAAEDLNILSSKTRQQALLIQLARSNAEFLADKSFRKYFVHDQSSAEEAFARMGTTQAMGFAWDMTYESGKLARNDSFFSSFHEPWLEKFKSFEMKNLELQTQLSALVTDPGKYPPERVADIFADLGAATLEFEQALKGYEEHLNEQELVNQRYASTIVWLVFFIQLFALAVASIYDLLIERNRA